MTSKHFILFAKILREVKPASKRLEFAEQLLPVLRASNALFNEEVFRKAANCQVDEYGFFKAAG